MFDMVDVDILVLGDPHLSGETEWQQAVAERVLSWVKNDMPTFVTPNTDVVILGDVIDKYSSNPITTEIITRFLQSISAIARHVHILVGNHDTSKKDKMPAGVHQFVAYRYIQSVLSNVTIYEYPTQVDIQGLSCVMLPYYEAPIHSLLDLNAENALERWQIDPTKQYDFVAVHHFLKEAAEGSRIPSELSIDINKLFDRRPRKVLAGHIHTTELAPNEYTGSLYPLKIDERGIKFTWTYSHATATWTRHVTPTFCELLSVKHGDELPAPSVKTALPVYTVTQCPSDAAAAALYPNAIIRKTVTSWSDIRQGRVFEEKGSTSQSALVTKSEVLDKFEEKMLADDLPQSKLDATVATLTAALQLIRAAAKDDVAAMHSASTN